MNKWFNEQQIGIFGGIESDKFDFFQQIDRIGIVLEHRALSLLFRFGGKEALKWAKETFDIDANIPLVVDDGGDISQSIDIMRQMVQHVAVFVIGVLDWVEAVAVETLSRELQVEIEEFNRSTDVASKVLQRAMEVGNNFFKTIGDMVNEYVGVDDIFNMADFASASDEISSTLPIKVLIKADDVSTNIMDVGKEMVDECIRGNAHAVGDSTHKMFEKVDWLN